MSEFFYDNVRSYSAADEAEVPLTPQIIESSLTYAFGRVLTEDISEVKKTTLLEQVRAEGVALGIDNERVRDLYLDVLTNLGSKGE